MRMFRLSSWISESRGCDKVLDGVADHKMADAIRPVAEIEVAVSAKRKRSDSESEGILDAPEYLADGLHDTKRRKPNATEEDMMHHSQDGKDIVMQDDHKPDVSSSLVRDVIQTQFGLEILQKHNELRLINQELAKCQVALEQLRRCHLIPYPFSEVSEESMVQVSDGTGPALARNDQTPIWASPYGVTDGPYSRHHAKWLLPDPRFDGPQAESQRGSDASRAGKTLPEGRATRNSIGDGTATANKSRVSRGSSSQKLQSLPSGYSQPKDKTGPCTLRRQDGQFVKLVCLDCQRENFSSTQGFINHCRIAHRRAFETHEDAAVACGQPIEVDDGGAVAGEERSINAATGLVHPLIRSAPIDPEARIALLKRIDASTALFYEGKHDRVTSIPTSATSTPIKPNKSFVPSMDLPHLSDLMRKKGFGTNLSEVVDEAKRPFELDDFELNDDESEDGESPVTTGFSGDLPLPAMRMPAGASMPPAPFARPTSSKGVDGMRAVRQAGINGISPRPAFATPLINTTAAANHNKPATQIANNHLNTMHIDEDHDAEIELYRPSHIDLSPNTSTSNNAPSLVSDDGEYDEGEDDAESVSSEGDGEDSDVAEIDIEDGDGSDKVVPRTALTHRAGSGGEAMRLKKEEKDKHVTFVSPVKDVKKERRNRK